MSIHTYYQTTSQPCGCQGACGCGQAACGSPREGGFTRPNFFAGQLLTDEDLRAALDYVVQKNRLHNRHFFGEGVVCGLEVMRHPCPDQKGKVIVRSGHALDCCGNDIVVPCEVELDVLKMVHQLRTKLRGGYDCLDPCGGEGTKNRNGKTPGTNAGGHGDASNAGVKLHLSVRYREVEHDLVEPYQVDQECDAPCRASRIRETYDFDLGCPKNSVLPDLATRLQECKDAVEGYRELQGQAMHAISTLEMAEKVLVQFETFIEPRPPEMPFEQIPDGTLQIFQRKLPERLRELSLGDLRKVSLESLKELLPADVTEERLDELARIVAAELLREQLLLASREVIGFDWASVSDVQKQREGADRAHRFLVAAFRYFYTPQENPREVPAAAREAQETLESKLSRLEDIKPTTFDAGPPVANIAIELLKRRNEHLKEVSFVSGESGEEFNSKARIVGELIGSNELEGHDIVRDAVHGLLAVNQQLRSLVAIGRVAIAPELHDATRDAAQALKIIAADVHHYLRSAGEIRKVKVQGEVVGRTVAEISRQCLCEIVLPPCPRCDDPDVLLAEITIRDCEVTEICNLQRRMVITGPSLRYWFSDFRALFDPIRKACCPSPELVVDEQKKARARHEKRVNNWRTDISDPASLDFIPRILKRADNPSDWEQLHAPALVGSLAQFAVEPPAQELFDADSYQDLSEQAINLALSNLAGRPASDIRDLLDWNQPLESPATIKRFAAHQVTNLKQSLEGELNSAVAKSDEAVSKSGAAVIKSERAEREASYARTLIDQEVRPGGGRDTAIEAAFDSGVEPIKTIKGDIKRNADAIKENRDGLGKKVNVSTHKELQRNFDKLKVRFDTHPLDPHPPEPE